MRIAIVGGTGKEGTGLAIRWGRAGHFVSIGSRDVSKATAKAAELAAAGHGVFEGGDNAGAARAGEVVVLTVPYAAHEQTLRAIQPGLSGKVLVDVTVPLIPPQVSRVQLPKGKAAALEAQQILGGEVQVVSALHHVSYVLLSNPGSSVQCDVLVAGDDAQARTRVIWTGEGSRPARARRGTVGQSDRARAGHLGADLLEQALQEPGRRHPLHQSLGGRLNGSSKPCTTPPERKTCPGSWDRGLLGLELSANVDFRGEGSVDRTLVGNLQ